jgi:Transposase DDE domain
MLLDTIFAPFVKERPICVMARASLERLLDAHRLDALFARTAERQYTRELLFSSLVQLMSEVGLGVHPTVHAAYQANKGAIGVSTTALYNKLDRVETGVSAALVRDSAALAEPVVKALRASHPRWVPGYQIKVLDGNHLSSTEHRLKELRGTWAAPLPGQALVVLDQQRMLITDVFLSEDGHAQERSLIAQVLHHVEEDQLWIEDRNFCTLGLMFGMARRGAAFAVRQHGQLQGELLGRATRQGTTRSGPVYEQPLLVRDPASGEPMRVRRITIELTEPTRDGDTVLHILSNVPIPRASAAQLARLYGKRWSIETAFFEITTTLSCEINTLGYPKAALFTFCLALLAYNAVSLIKAALRRVHGRQKVNDEVSGYYLSLEIGRTYDGMMIAIPTPHWALFRELSAKEFANVLRELASSVNLARYQKHPRGPKKKPSERTAYQNGKHVSTAKLIAHRWAY